MVWPQLFGDYVSADAPQWRKISGWITQQHVGGIIMSVGSPLEIAAKLNALQRMSDLPLLVGGDLEFGAGYRARGGYFLPNGIDLGGAVLFPPEMAIGATRDTMLAYEQGRITAIEGRAIGFHIDFSPILDVNNNPANPVISTRSFGEDPALVAQLGAAFIRGVQEHGMIATGKHFPGHGDTGTNSHLALPVVRVSRARLDSVELVPFEAAVKADVGAIMTFHGSMPALDSSGVPGTLSHNVLTSLLRDEMHFHGLVVSDAMDMRGVLEQLRRGERGADGGGGGCGCAATAAGCGARPSMRWSPASRRGATRKRGSTSRCVASWRRRRAWDCARAASSISTARGRSSGTRRTRRSRDSPPSDRSRSCGTVRTSFRSAGSITAPGFSR